MNAVLRKTIEPLLTLVISQVLKQITSKAQMQAFVDDILDSIENKVKASESKWDDRVILPVITAIRANFDIPDDDE